MKSEKIIIVGGSGSGKDYLLRGLIIKGQKYSPKVTTRPMRSGEVNGLDYHYMNNDDYIKLQDNNQIKVEQKFVINGIDWWYGITSENFYKNNVFIMTPYEIEQLSEEDRNKCFVVYLAIEEDIRHKRIMERYDNNDSIERRLKSDSLDFQKFEDYDMKITDHEFEVNWVWDFTF